MSPMPPFLHLTMRRADRLMASPNTVYSCRILRAPTHVHSRSPVVTPTQMRCWPSLMRFCSSSAARMPRDGLSSCVCPGSPNAQMPTKPFSSQRNCRKEPSHLRITCCTCCTANWTHEIWSFSLAVSDSSSREGKPRKMQVSGRISLMKSRWPASMRERTEPSTCMRSSPAQRRCTWSASCENSCRWPPASMSSLPSAPAPSAVPLTAAPAPAGTTAVLVPALLGGSAAAGRAAALVRSSLPAMLALCARYAGGLPRTGVTNGRSGPSMRPTSSGSISISQSPCISSTTSLLPTTSPASECFSMAASCAMQRRRCSASTRGASGRSPMKNSQRGTSGTVGSVTTSSTLPPTWNTHTLPALTMILSENVEFCTSSITGSRDLPPYWLLAGTRPSSPAG
mmetsp:Transcript_34017/g.86114  ORF Transcript_34017/g.86114 Transcript_34017/m.86114 type:complete len:397 (-) Transcript_34017:608-1798(-)